MSIIWNSNMEEELAELVEVNPMLWNKRIDLYHRPDHASAKWEEIGIKFGCTGEAVRKQFILLRRRYMHHTKVVKANKSCSAASSSFKCYSLFKKLQFLELVMESRTSSNKRSFPMNVTEPSNSPQPSQSNLNIISPPPTETSCIEPQTKSRRQKDKEQLYTTISSVAMQIREKLDQEVVTPPPTKNQTFCNMLNTWLDDLPKEPAEDLRDEILELYLNKKKIFKNKDPLGY